MEADVRNVIQAQIRIIRGLKLVALQLEYTTDDIGMVSFLLHETSEDLREERAKAWVAVSALAALMKPMITAIEKGKSELLPFEVQKFVDECDRNLREIEPRISLRAELERKAKKEDKAKQGEGLSDSTAQN